MRNKVWLISMIVCLMAFLVPALSIHAVAEPYPKTWLVEEVYQWSDIVIVIDPNGHRLWFYGAEDWMKGDVVSAIMEDNGTPCLFDDNFASLRYEGWIF